MEDRRMTPRITFISASAGSGKTHRVVDTIEERLVSGACRPGGLIATTFTVKAAHELRERVRGRLHHRGHTALAERLDEGLIGTVHGVCRQLLERFTFEAGISPRIEILAEEQASELLAQAVESVADFPTLQRLQQIAVRLGQQDRQTHEFNWKSQVREIVNAVQANDLDEADFPAMADRSVAELLAFLPPPTTGDLDRELLAAISTAIGRISGNGDETVTTRKYLDFLRDCRRDLENASLSWSAWVKIAKDPPAKASQAEATPVMGTAARFETHPRLREDIREYTTMLFTLAQRCITGYRRLKEERGFMDFSDLEQRTLRLLRDVPFAKEVLREELDLLVVDEFQDTSPIQLGLFMELAACGRETVWVGD
ncbi:MAG: DNA helicase UvrD, partial [Planctomycetes bacterium]|nr:DNA helicase UvrD [Planctomycetota bacterium]